MSKPFYNYLAKKVKKYFETLGVKAGDRFDIQFEKEEEVRDLYNEIPLIVESQLFSYQAKENAAEYETYYFKVGEVKIIVAATIDGIQPDYLTRLRNEVGSSEKNQFSQTAILFIHNTNLDSIIGGAISFKKEGMPFHLTSVTEDIRLELKESTLKEGLKSIIEYELEKNTSLGEDGISLLQFEELLKVVNSEKIDKTDFKNFGLFYDPQLEGYAGKEAKDRIKENAEIFARVDSIHKFQGDVPSALEKFLDEKGVTTLSDPMQWEDVDFSEVRKSIENKIKTKKVRYEGYELLNIEEDNFWDKPEKENEAGKRKRRIIIFNPQRETNLKFELKFDERITQKEIKSDNVKFEAKASGKKMIVDIQHEVGRASFGTLKLKASENYEYKIVVLDIENSIFKDTELQTGFNLGKYKGSKEQVITLNLESPEFIINPNGTEVETVEIKNQNEDVFLDSLSTKLILKNNVELDENVNMVKVNLLVQGFQVPLTIKDEGNVPVRISGQNVWTQKREEKKHFKYIGDRLVQGSRTYFATEEFRLNLKREQTIVTTGALHYIEKGEEIFPQELDVPSSLKDCYDRLVHYYQANNVLPSLAYYSKELYELSMEYVNAYLGAVSSLEEGGYVTNLHHHLIKVGTLNVEGLEEQVLITPLHPLNVLYQMVLKDEIGSERLHESLSKKLDSLYLLPYLSENKELYKPLEQNHSKEWKYYVKNNTHKFKSSRKFVSKLVKEKLEEFTEHFSYLFQFSQKSPMKINLINTGDSHEVLQGIINYYIEELKKKKPSQLREININIYSEEESSIFEELSYYETVKEIEDNLDLSLEGVGINKDYFKEDILAICREKIKFYRKDIHSIHYDYCHITFYEMDTNYDERDSKLNDLITGTSLNGIISGVPSRYINETYRTGFGTRYDNSQSSKLLQLASRLNSLYKAVQHETSYTSLECRTTMISKQDKEKLDKIYNSSNWVTFIEPKVDLQFFKNDSKNNDLLIIHYSDQYTSSSGYDAITVTRKSKQYEDIIKEFLTDNKVDITHESIVDIINCFNAVNGDWLLRLISDKGQFPREKISIISAIKFSLAYFYHPEIIWIPISLEEVLRVSKGAALSGSEGLFSVKNLKGEGQYSDDLLLVGVQVTKDGVKVYYYPVEVKIGEVSSAVINKAKKQAYKTRNYLEKHMLESAQDDENRSFAKKMYRNFMIQLAIVSAEKMKLYDVWKEQHWDIVVDSDVRRILLNDEYEISMELDELIGRGAVMAFKKGITFNDEANFIELKKEELDQEYVEEEFNKGNQFLQIIFAESQGYFNIVERTEKIKNRFINGQSDFNKEKLLCNLLKNENGTVEEIATIQLEKPSYEPIIDDGQVAEVPIDHSVVESVANQGPLTVLFGTNDRTGEEVKWYPTDTTKVLHSNTGIIGTMGTGKTQFTKSLIYQLHANSGNNVEGKDIGLLIFDYKGDYIDDDFVNATNAKVYDIYRLPYNPLALVKGNKPKPLLPLHTANALKETISKAFNLGIKQSTLLREIIMEAYEKRGIKKGDPSTWDNIPPTLHDVCKLYLENEDVAQDSLYAALTNLYEFEIFEPDPKDTQSLFDIIDGVTVINLSSYDPGIQNLVVAITLDIFYSQMLTVGESKMKGQYRQLTNLVLVDEADNFLSKNFESLRKILKEGRMFGVGTILSTQLLSHFSTGDNEYANYILTWIVHNVSDLNNKDVKFIFNTKGKEEEETIYRKIKTLEKHHSLVKLGGEQGPISIKDKAFWELMK